MIQERRRALEPGPSKPWLFVMPRGGEEGWDDRLTPFGGAPSFQSSRTRRDHPLRLSRRLSRLKINNISKISQDVLRTGGFSEMTVLVAILKVSDVEFPRVRRLDQGLGGWSLFVCCVRGCVNVKVLRWTIEVEVAKRGRISS